MLIQQHSIDKFEELLSNVHNIPIVVSVSQQSLYSLWAMYNTTPPKMFQVLTDVLKEKGVSKVYDTSLAQNIALIESFNEFTGKYKESAKYSLVMDFYNQTKNMSDEEVAQATVEFKKELAKVNTNPVLCSEWPGWVWYAEKVVGELAIPFMSVVKSPQQIQGYLLKKVANQIFLNNEEVNSHSNFMHVWIMPCYDKKLEAVRPAGTLSSSPVIKEVDAVLATHEICNFFTSHNIDITLKLTSLPSSLSLDSLDQDLSESSWVRTYPFYALMSINQSSNGYSEYILRSAIKSLFTSVSIRS